MEIDRLVSSKGNFLTSNTFKKALSQTCVVVKCSIFANKCYALVNAQELLIVEINPGIKSPFVPFPSRFDQFYRNLVEGVINL